MTKVLITDGFEKEGIERLIGEGFHVVNEKFSPEELIKQIPQYDALIVRSATKVTKEVIDEGAKGNLEIIGRSGVGTDNIDVKYATEKGIVVKFAPSGATISVAELTIGLMLDLSRKISMTNSALNKGFWKKENGGELFEKTLGIIGCGRIGKRVAYIAKHGFDMKVLGKDTVQDSESGIDYTTLDELLSKSDYITLNIPKLKEPVITLKELSSMKKTAYLIDVSRGGNVDEAALYTSLKNGGIAGAAKDVFVKEGSKFEEEYSTNKNPLIELDNFIGTPHLGASTREGQLRTGMEMANVIINYLKNGDFGNTVNLGQKRENEDITKYKVSIHHEDIPGMFGQIGSIFGKYNINILNQPTEPLKNGKIITHYLVEKPVSDDILNEIKALNGVYRVKK